MGKTKAKKLPHKSGIIILVPQVWSRVFTRSCLALRPEESFEYLNHRDIPNPQPMVKVFRECWGPNHYQFECPTRLPLVIEGESYQIVSWDFWIEKFANPTAVMKHQPEHQQRMKD